jgi:hypothetical protein
MYKIIFKHNGEGLFLNIKPVRTGAGEVTCDI